MGEWTQVLPDPSAVAPLEMALDRAEEDWIAQFRDSQGVAGLCLVRGGNTSPIFLAFNVVQLMFVCVKIPIKFVSKDK